MTTPMQSYIDKKLTHQIHTSERRSFRACRRRWNWVYRDMYAPLVHSGPLEFGTAFHKGLEIFYNPATWTQSLATKMNLAIVNFKAVCDSQLKEYKRHEPDPSVDVLNDYKGRVELGVNMLKYYCQDVEPSYDQGWVPIATEVEFEVPITNPDNKSSLLWCKCQRCRIKWTNYYREEPSYDWNGLPVTYGGRIDALFKDKNNRLWIVDWKTTTRLLVEDQETQFLQLDDQVASYVWAVSQLEILATGFVYVEFKKTYPTAPEKLTRAYKGRMFSTNKQVLTTYKMALDTFRTEDNDAWQMGLYDPYLSWLKNEGPRFTQRHQILKNEHEIEEIGRSIWLEAKDMIGDPSVYPQPGRFSCNWCLFQQPCLGKNMGEDFQYTLDTLFEKRDKLYYEVTPI